ncbi:hypothetical protein PVAND_011935 [Polypedilum vanderplanki]|uniref:TEP1-F n=1 Tax=Polypedilum vanderplanki TaxID=319348 RepID=A0A9J6CLV9_POLVA|nr:hypothetical protein PVAND_011935 [Polypedilum vanderplanki]
MIIGNLFLIGVILLNSLASAKEGYFTVIGSKFMRPKKPYRVTVHYEGFNSEKTLEIGIEGANFSTKEIIQFTNDGDKEIIFNTPNDLKGVYNLEVKSRSGDKFESSRKIHVKTKQYSVFIQTDKSIYKPADKVQFRILLLNDETRPFIPSKVVIYITDGENNRIKQYDRPQFDYGIFQNELKLSDLPVMEKWKINVKINSQNEKYKKFEVAEYVLPKFEFILDANPDANFKDGKITATARAKYIFGKIAKGNATITAEKRNNVEFDIEKELGITYKDSEHTVHLSATFTEELSGKEQNATAKVQIHITPHKIEMKKSGEKFKPGLSFKVTAIVRYHDKNAPVTDTYYHSGHIMSSTWLTAFVAKFFHQAAKYIHIDQNIVKQALNFLKYVQKPDGSFQNNVIEKAIEYILNNVEEITDNYSLAIASYALQLAQHHQKNNFLRKINGRAINENGMKFWIRDEEKSNSRKPNLVNIEMTAYGLQAFLEADQNIDALAIGKWLITQPRYFDVSASGSGMSILQISYRYNIDDSLKQPRLTLSSHIENDSNVEYLHISVCTSFISDNSTEISNMAVMEINLPSGFTYDTDHIEELKSNQRVKKVELKEGDTKVIVYFDNIDSIEICPEFKSYRSHGIAKQKPSPIIIYDYYDNSRAARAFYSPPFVSLCDICSDDDECSDDCEVKTIQID